MLAQHIAHVQSAKADAAFVEDDAVEHRTGFDHLQKEVAAETLIVKFIFAKDWWRIARPIRRSIV